jgi:hypothetical protein
MVEEDDPRHLVLYCRGCGEWRVDEVDANVPTCWHCHRPGLSFIHFRESEGTLVSSLLLRNRRNSARMPWVI